MINDGKSLGDLWNLCGVFINKRKIEEQKRKQRPGKWDPW